MVYSAPTMGSAGAAASSGLSSLEPVSSVKSPWTCISVSAVKGGCHTGVVASAASHSLRAHLQTPEA